jgi:hypothetical protein
MTEPYQPRTRTKPIHVDRKTAQYYKRGLMLIGETARALEVDHDILKSWSQAGLIPTVEFTYKGQVWRGFPVADVLALRRKMGLTP